MSAPVNGVSWAVEYTDGSVIEQYGSKREQDNVEFPLKLIEWDRVRRVLFESQDMTYSYVLPHLAEEYKWSMRIRHYRLTGSVDGEVLVMILLASDKDKEVTEDTIHFALYVSPDGIIHFCDMFDCSHLPDYYHGKLDMRDVTVPQLSWREKVITSAELVKE